MKLRILLVIIMLLLPIKAQAAITWDFSAISGTIQTVVTNVKTQIDTAKSAILEWKFVQHLGSYITMVSDFFQSVKNEYEKIKARYEKWQDDINKFKERLQSFYYSAMSVYESALDAAEYVSEIGKRIQAYLNETKDIIRNIRDVFDQCLENANELVKFRRHYREQITEARYNIEAFTAEKQALDAEIAALDAELANNPDNANQITIWLREKRERVSLIEGKIDNFNQLFTDLNNQIRNFIASQKALVYECTTNVRMLKGRINRLICYISAGGYKGYESKINQIGNNLNKWNNSLISLDNATQDLENDFAGCSDVAQTIVSCDICEATQGADSTACENCNLCKPTQGGDGVINYIPSDIGDEQKCEQKLQEIVSMPSMQSCADYKKTCDKEVEKGNPTSETCQISCSSMCNTISPSSGTCCAVFRAKCQNNNGYCDKYRNHCSGGLSFNYSISTSSTTAFAFSFDEDLTKIDTKSGTDKNGNFLIPDNLSICCQLDSQEITDDANNKSEDKVGELYNCISRFLNVLHTAAGTEISSDDKHFFQCLRKEINRKDVAFDDKVRASDNLAAGVFLEEAYAEYLAGGYLDALQTYQNSMEYVEEEINSVSTSYKDIGSTWAAVMEMNLKINDRINEIGKLWSREHLIKSVDNARSYKPLENSSAGGNNAQ